jgi:hypothetical protein
MLVDFLLKVNALNALIFASQKYLLKDLARHGAFAFWQHTRETRCDGQFICIAAGGAEKGRTACERRLRLIYIVLWEKAATHFTC